MFFPFVFRGLRILPEGPLPAFLRILQEGPLPGVYIRLFKLKIPTGKATSGILQEGPLPGIHISFSKLKKPTGRATSGIRFFSNLVQFLFLES